MTIALVFGPKILRILRGQGDQWDQRARKRGITASFSLNGIGLVPEETADLYQENEELKVSHQAMYYMYNKANSETRKLDINPLVLFIFFFFLPRKKFRNSLLKLNL